MVGFGPVAVAAIWALFRPGRRLAIVGSVALWRDAQNAMATTARPRAKRVTLAWLLLLAGSVACAAALTRPSINASITRRRVALVLLPSAELGRDKGIKAMQDAARGLLNRLDTRDAVRVIVPRETGMTAFKGDMSVDQARAAVSSLEPLPIPARQLSPVEVGKDVQSTYTFVVAGGSADKGAAVGVVEIPHGLPGVTIDAIGAEEIPGGKMQVLLALRKQGGVVWTGKIGYRGVKWPKENKFDAPIKGPLEWTALQDVKEDEEVKDKVKVKDKAKDKAMSVEIRSPRKEIVFEVDSHRLLAIHAVNSDIGAFQKGTQLDASAYLVRRRARRTKVAVIGQGGEMLAKFVQSDPTLELVGPRDKGVELVIADGVDPPAGKAAIVFNPPTPPKLCTRLAKVNKANLEQADVLADHPVMRNVLLDGVHVAPLTPWKFGKHPLHTVLVSYKGDAVVIKQRIKHKDSATAGPPRVYVAFSVAPENTAFGMTKVGVIFLANSVRDLARELDRDLAPGAAGKAMFEYVSPASIGPAGGRSLLAPPPDKGGKAPEDSSRYPWPGAYHYGDGKLHAVSIVGLRPAEPTVAPDAAVRSLKLPEPRRDTVGFELWPALLAAGGLLWLAAWWAKLR